jgi:CRP-like cAMP-binding protein
MEGMAMLDLLKEVRVCKGCTEAELQEIAKICERVTLKNGERVFEAQGPAEYLYVVGKGLIDLRFDVTNYLASAEITLDQIGKGEIFGWSTFAYPYLYTVSAIAVRDSELLRIKQSDLTQVCTSNIHLGYGIMSKIAQTISERFALVQKILVNEVQHGLRKNELSR